MRKKIGRKIAAFLVVVTPLQLWLFSHYNNILKEPQSLPVTETKTKTPPTTVKDATEELAAMSKQYQAVSLSDDETAIAYVDSNQNIHVKSLTNGQDSTVVQMKAPVMYLKWIGSDSLFVGEKFTMDGVHHLTLATVDLQTKEPRVIKAWSGINSTTTFKKIAFSPATNDVYVLLGSKVSSTLYHFDTMGTPTVVYLDGRLVENVDVGQFNGVLFFQDFAEGTKNVLYYQHHAAQLIQRNCAILGVVNNDLYYGTLDSNGLVNQVYVYPTHSAATSGSGGSGNTTSGGSGSTSDTGNGPAQLVKTLSSPVDASRILVTSDKQIVITPA